MKALQLYELDHARSTWVAQTCKYFVDIFRIRQLSADFNLDIVEKVIASIGNTVLVVQPSLSPETLKRIFCVFEVYSTIQSQAIFDIVLLDEQEVHDMMGHKDVYEKICTS